MMKLATWNVNSIRVREERLLRWLAAHQPDVMCLQELKVEEAKFPFESLRQAGYHAAVFGQRTYNGVAILSRTEPTDVRRGMEDAHEDAAARLIAATIDGIRIASVYVPNGGVVGSDKWIYKIEWLQRLRAWLERNTKPETPLALGGDFNVAPEPRDVEHPAVWEASVLFHPEARAGLRHVLDWGLTDAFRLHYQEAGLYSWWDYRMLAFPKNDGLRIDHVFVTAPLVPACTGAAIDRPERKGKQPSDHAPVMVTFSGA